MKRLIFASLIILATVSAQSARRSLAEMKAAAEGVIKPAALATRNGVAQMKTLKHGAQFTILGYDNGGFAVIANDDKFRAVLGYSSDGKFSEGNIAPAMLWWLDAVDEALQHMLESGETAVSGAELRDTSLPEAVPAMLTTVWDQGEPYNRVVAEKFDGKDVPTGCVATAMSQLMRYHSWPVTGTGHTSYRYQGSLGNKTFQVDFSRTAYDYDNMLDSYVAGSYTDLQADAVATLMYHCGVAVEMDYDLDGSGTLNTKATQAFDKYFSYSAKYRMRDIYAESEWMNTVYGEIAAGRPVLYGGNDARVGGHAFVIDGYDADGLVHVNWGWSGAGTAYCDIAVLNSGQGSFSEGQDMITAFPGDDGKERTSQFGMLKSVTWGNGSTSTGRFTVSVRGGQLTYSVGDILNCDAYDFTGSIALIAQDEASGRTFTLDWLMKNVSLAANAGYPEVGSGTASTAVLSDGTYRVYLASKSFVETAWQPVRGGDDVTDSYIMTVNGGTATVTAGEPGWTTGIQGIEAAGADGDGIVRVYTADGVLVYTSPAGSFSLSDVPTHGLLIVKNGAKTAKVMK